MSDAVLVERRGRILVITINRPQARNAINLEVSQALADAMDELDDSPDLSVAILTGAGGNFCAGMDLKAFAAGERVAVEGRGLGFTQKPPRKPVIAAVEGFALAGGTELVLATDLVVASRSARFGIPEVRRGLVAGAGGLLRLPRKIPYQKALELALTGDDFTAEQAAGWGLVNILTEDGGSSGRSNPSRGEDHRERPAGRRHHQADHRRVGVVGRRREVGPAGRAARPGLHLEGRPRGREGVRGEAQAAVDRVLSPARPREIDLRRTHVV